VIEPLKVVKTYSVQWQKPRIDRAELARLRFIEKWSLSRLAAHYGKSKNAIEWHLQVSRKRDFKLPGLSETERKKILWILKN
jgi:hypothetical protein